MFTKKYSNITTKYARITKQMIREGVRLGIIKFDHAPCLDHGTVCYIGKYWFWFGGQAADELEPDEYLQSMPIDDIVNEIYNVLNVFSTAAGTKNEYAYYNNYLRTNL